MKWSGRERGSDFKSFEIKLQLGQFCPGLSRSCVDQNLCKICKKFIRDHSTFRWQLIVGIVQLYGHLDGLAWVSNIRRIHYTSHVTFIQPTTVQMTQLFPQGKFRFLFQFVRIFQNLAPAKDIINPTLYGRIHYTSQITFIQDYIYSG